MVKAYQLAAVNTHKLALSLGDGQQMSAFLLYDLGIEFQDNAEWLQTLPEGDDFTDPKVRVWEEHLYNTISSYMKFMGDHTKSLSIYSDIHSPNLSNERRYGIGDFKTFLIHDHGAAMANTTKISSLSVTRSSTVQEITDWVIGVIDKLACQSRGSA